MNNSCQIDRSPQFSVDEKPCDVLLGNLNIGLLNSSKDVMYVMLM
ncbi:hypothetical protein EMUCRT_0568 [Ehrlichia cf. muris str. EmCRT]|uniref:Uncharacterized protein n=1 Tax=Ehrlichia cf. muris str. EmCRT TaxID=1359167 RepID=A0A0F3NC29_9RICK|nr:hypothetical protein EMUCRT_0568 [Ehrlichia cf. muris str. EmCRT]